MRENEQSPSSGDGMLAAVNAAEEPNYLGDPDVIDRLIRDYANRCIVRVSGMTDRRQEAAEMDMADAKALAAIFLGRDEGYTPMSGWNKPGVIDQWLADELKIKATEPVERVARTLVIYLLRMYDVWNQIEAAPDDVGDQMLVDGLVSEFTNLLAGNSEWDSSAE